MNDFNEVISKIQTFQTESLSAKTSTLESTFQGVKAKDSVELLREIFIDEELLQSAFQIKSVAGQINVIIHTVGILLSLSEILHEGEIVQNLSLGAGNTGRDFDLETNLRIAEFKFIQWKGGAESIRQNQLFKDFYSLAEFNTTKAKYQYVLGLEIPMKFFHGKRALSSVFSKNIKLWEEFQEKYGGKLKTVRDYYQFKKDTVILVDLCDQIPFFAEFQ